ncbi:MAG: YggS family pyridoxal phosphate-dependent enzyme [Alphaproteobacteria bacterium]|nr:YggS family pyridoxal phosphate-dependent enzyme [Alphaproteobacteria bacterium]
MTVTAPQSDATLDVAATLAQVERHIIEAAEAAGREAGEIGLVAISKTHEAARIRPALAAGQRRFGENRVQEAAAKWPALREEWPDLVLHLVGPLQTNKARQAVELFDLIETVDRPKLARVLAREMERSGRRPDCLIEVNVGQEPQKAGVVPHLLEAFIKECRESYQLPLAGLMCIPPIDQEPAPYFALLAKLAAENGLAAVSMGMSADYQIAIEFGATLVRVGTAIFGPRQPYPRS